MKMTGQTEQAKTFEPTIEAKTAFLRAPANYPHGPAAVRVEETHMSWVFLAGDRVFKMKKPVRYPFLDFSTLAARAHFVHEEIRLNRRLAGDVYKGTAALTLTGDGALCLGGSGPVVEWLVEMRRLPAERMLDQLLLAGGATGEQLAGVAALLIEFYAGLPSEPIDPERYAARFRHQHAETSQVLLDPRFAFDGPRVASVLAAFEHAFRDLRPVMDQRVVSGRIVEGHGDLRPEHVCIDEPPVIIDCLEFDRALRLVDPFDEIAYLGLECARLDADWVLPLLRDKLCEGLSDDPRDELLAFYWRYRALLRARLALLHLVEPDPRTPEKWRPLAWRYIELAEQAEVSCRSPTGR